MKVMMGKNLVYFVSFVYALSCSVASAAMERNMAEEGYPIVYMMDIPISTHASITGVVAELDLLNSETSHEDGIVRLSFMVHDQEEEDYISKQFPSFDMVKDSQETSNLHSLASTPISRNQQADTISGFPCYRNLAGMIALMTELEEKASSIDRLNVKVTDIGDSYEKTVNSNKGYDMLALKITGDGVAAKGWSTEKGVVFITCGIHAREYSPPELCARWAESLVDGYGVDTEITSVLDHTEVHLILESNPDGRAIAETNRQVYHRKNTRPGCFSNNSRGVDLNRNFPFKWGGTGSSGSKCGATYRGSAPASEPEVQAIIQYAEGVFPESQRKDNPVRDMNKPYPEDSTLGVYIDIHAYSDLIIWPWTHADSKVTANEESHQAAARKLKSFNGYALAGPGQPDWLYAADGVTCDWFYGELGALSMVYELGTNFYQDCPTFENKIHPDNIPGFMYTAKISTKPYHLTKGPDVTDHSVPSTIDYDSNENLEFSVTVSDRALSAGPGQHKPSTQDIVSISLCADMHPYDIDGDGLGPKVVTVNVSGGTTVTETISLSLSTPNFLRDPLAGDHILYLHGTDSDGSLGPVTAVAFTITGGGGGGEPCDGLEKQECKKKKEDGKKVCTYSKKKKISEGCIPKKSTYEHNCVQYTGASSCTSGDHEGLCEWNGSGSCSHKCDGLKGNSCKKAKFLSTKKKMCKVPRIANPCYECHPRITCKK